jgi:hypothetical protein
MVRVPQQQHGIFSSNAWLSIQRRRSQLLNSVQNCPQPLIPRQIQENLEKNTPRGLTPMGMVVILVKRLKENTSEKRSEPRQINSLRAKRIIPRQNKLLQVLPAIFRT